MVVRTLSSYVLTKALLFRTGPIAQAIVPQIVSTLNSGEVVFPRSAYLNMLHQEVSVITDHIIYT